MRRLARLEVSLDLAMCLFMVWLLFRGIIPLATHNRDFTYRGGALDYLHSLRGFLWGGGGGGLALGVVGLAWLETRRALRPWFKRALRLSGQLLVVSILVCFWVFYRSFHPT